MKFLRPEEITDEMIRRGSEAVQRMAKACDRGGSEQMRYILTAALCDRRKRERRKQAEPLSQKEIDRLLGFTGRCSRCGVGEGEACGNPDACGWFADKSEAQEAAPQGANKGKVIGVAATVASTDSGAGGADEQLPPARFTSAEPANTAAVEPCDKCKTLWEMVRCGRPHVIIRDSLYSRDWGSDPGPTAVTAAEATKAYQDAKAVRPSTHSLPADPTEYNG